MSCRRSSWRRLETSISYLRSCYFGAPGAWPFWYIFFAPVLPEFCWKINGFVFMPGNTPNITKLLRSNLPSRFFQAGNWFWTFLDPVAFCLVNSLFEIYPFDTWSFYLLTRRISAALCQLYLIIWLKLLKPFTSQYCLITIIPFWLNHVKTHLLMVKIFMFHA